MKKILSILLSTTLISACGGGSGGSPEGSVPSSSPSASASPGTPGGSNSLEAVDDNFTVEAGASVFLDVLANDRFSNLATVEIILDSDSSYRVVDGKIEFTAPNSDTFLRSFNYQLSENGKSSELATVRVEQANDTTNANLKPESDSFILQPGMSSDLDVLANDVSSIQSPLSISEIILEPLGGTASIENNLLRYQANENFSGTDRLSYRVQDSVGNSYGGVNVDILVEAKRSGRYAELYTTDIASFEQEDVGKSLPRYYAKGSGYVNPAGVGDLNGDGFNDTLSCIAQAPTMNSELQVIDEQVGECILTLGGSRTNIANRQYIIRGHEEGERFGVLLSHAGDIDGDGFDDAMILSGSSNNLQPYILYGRATFESPLTTNSSTDLSALLHSSADISFAAGVGDINNDGFADIAIQIIGNNETRELQLLFGGEQRLSGNIERDELASRRFIYSPQLEDDIAGIISTRGSIRALGDYDGDGFDDFGLAGTLSSISSTHHGAVIIFGQASYGSSPVVLNQMNALFLSAEQSTSEQQVNIGAVIDLNGDMQKELLIQHGNEILIFDRENNKRGSLALWDTNRQLGKITGITSTVTPYTAGDINNDGIEDAILNSISSSKPVSVIIYGQNSISPDINIDDLRFTNGGNGEQGALIYSKRKGLNLSSHLWTRAVGDIDGDGLDDLAVGGFLVEGTDDIADFDIIYGASHWGFGN